MLGIVSLVQSDSGHAEERLAFVRLSHGWLTVHDQAHVLEVLLGCLFQVPNGAISDVFWDSTLVVPMLGCSLISFLNDAGLLALLAEHSHFIHELL